MPLITVSCTKIEMYRWEIFFQTFAINVINVNIASFCLLLLALPWSLVHDNAVRIYLTLWVDWYRQKNGKINGRADIYYLEFPQNSIVASIESIAIAVLLK